MINIPTTNKQWKQANQSDLLGNVYITKNITFDTEGYLRLSYSPRSAINEVTDTDFNNPAVILYSENYGYFVETWEEAFQVDTSILATTPTQIVTAGVPSGDIQSDAVWFGGLMPVSQDTDVDYYTPSGGWTDTDITLTNTAQSQHQMVNFLSLSALAIADVNTVKLYASPLTATPTLITTLTISLNFHITAMCYFNQNLYIATQDRYGGHAFMYVWNGLGTAAQQVYEVDSNMIFSICAYKNSVALLTGAGSILQFNGGGFDLLAGFPSYYTDQSISDTTNIDMYKNVMKANGDLLYILFNNSNNNQNRLLSQPDGIWCYDETVGLYHRYSLSNAIVSIQTIATANVNTTTEQITVSSPAVVTGTETFYSTESGTAIGGLTDKTKYYVIKIDATHIQLASTLANAVAGVPINLTGTGNSAQKFTFFPNIDFGQYFTERMFALTVIERPVDNRIYGTDVLWGAEIIRRDNAGDYANLGTVSDGVEARGYFVTPKIFSSNVTDTQNRVTLKFSKFTSELNKIIIKYRTYDDMRQYINTADWDMTWTSTTTFTSTETGWIDAVVGNEVEILEGAGGGLLAHITNISINAGTYTITLDDSYDNYTSGDIGKAIFRNWIKWKTIVYGDSNANQYFLSDQLGVDGKFVEFKIELRGVQTRIEELLVDNVSRLPAKK